VGAKVASWSTKIHTLILPKNPRQNEGEEEQPHGFIEQDAAQ